MRQKLHMLASLLFIVPVSASELTLDKLFSYASEHALSLQISGMDIQISEAKLSGVYAEYYPSFSLVYTGDYNKDLQNTGNGVESVGDTLISSETAVRSSLSVQMNYEIFRFGATAKAVDAAKEEISYGRSFWCNEEKSLHRNILEQYNGALNAECETEFKAQMLIFRQEMYSMRGRLYTAGKISKVELGDEAVAVLELQKEIYDAKERYRRSIEMLLSLSYYEINIAEDKLLPMSTRVLPSASVEFAQSSEGRMFLSNIRQKEKLISRQYGEFLPVFSLYGNYYMYGTDPQEYMNTLETLHARSWNVGFSMQWQLFNGFKSSSELERLKYELKKLQLDYTRAEHEYKVDAVLQRRRLYETEEQVLKAKELLQEKTRKQEMIERLREKEQVDSLNALEAEYDSIKQAMRLALDLIAASYANRMYEISQQGIDQCTLR